MNRRTLARVALVITFALVAVIFVALVNIGCTLVYVSGDANRINDTGGDLSRSLTLNRKPQPASAPDIKPDPHHH